MLLAVSLITYISYQFLFYFLPEFYIIEGNGFFCYFIRLAFTYYAMATYIFIFKCFFYNPGFVPNKFKTPKTEDGLAPVSIMRIYTLRSYLANNIHNWDKYRSGYAAGTDIESNDDFCISINSSQDSSQGAVRRTDNRLIH